MSELTMDRLRENLESLKMKNTLEILECGACPWCNYLERAVADKLNIVEVLDHIFSKRPNPNANVPTKAGTDVRLPHQENPGRL